MHSFTTAENKHLTNILRRQRTRMSCHGSANLMLVTFRQSPTAFDLVTEADTEAEKMITAALNAAYPQALVVGEEAVAADSTIRDALPDAPLAFLVDPVDGTWNFARGLATFGTILAATHFGRPVLGLIYDPIGDDVIYADKANSTRYQTAPRH